MDISQLTKSPVVQAVVRAGSNQHVRDGMLAIAVLISGIALATLIVYVRRKIATPKTIGQLDTAQLSRFVQRMGPPGSPHGGEDTGAGMRVPVRPVLLDSWTKAGPHQSPWNHEADGIVLPQGAAAAAARALRADAQEPQPSAPPREFD